MALTNAQYDKIMREYEQQQAEDRRDQMERLEEAYAAIPQLRALDAEIGTQAAESARELIAGDDKAMERFREKAEEIKERRKELLLRAGFPADHTEMRYRCPDCKDTGYINGQKCHCFEEARIRTLYDQSSLKNILERENFSTLDEDIYDDCVIIPEFGMSQREYMKNIVGQCRDIADNFPQKGRNILFTGPTGVGKTFLSNCIAKELIDHSFSVIYLVAQDFFEILSRYRFGKDDETAGEAYRGILDCDLLILDDLGTEVNSSFVASQLFYCINGRIEREKGTIISTNLSLGGLRDRYSDRVTSRLMSAYDMMPLYGSDLRLKEGGISS